MSASTYTFAEHVLASGTLKLSLINNYGSDTVSLSGSRILSVATVTEEVEESGIGGVLRVPDFEVEIYDTDGVLKDTVFNRTNVTQCDARIILNVDGTDEGVMYGDVDLTTIEYDTYYDNETGTERHSCKFIIFSLLKRLESVSVETLRTAVEAFKVTRSLHTALEVTTSAFGNTASDVILGGSATTWTTASYAGTYADTLSAHLELIANGDYGDYLQVTGFLFDVPVGATVRGFVFTLHYKTGAVIGSENGIKFHLVKLVKGGAIVGSDFAPVGNIDHTLTYGTTDVGSKSQLGGLAWTPAEANASDTGIAFALERSSVKLVFNVFADVDYVSGRVYYESGALDDRQVVKELDVVKALQESIIDSASTDAVTHSIVQVFVHEDDANPETDETYDNLYHLWRNDVSGLFDRLWLPNQSGSFSLLRSAQDILKAIAGMRLAYPILVYTPNTGHVHFKLKQRGAGTLYASSDLGILKSSKLQTFIGYDAFRISFFANGLLKYSPSSITQDEFNLLSQKFDFPSYFGMTLEEIFVSAENFVDVSHYMWVPDGTLASTLSNVNRIDDNATSYTAFAAFLLAKFNEFWGENQMYTRTYEGVGIGGANPVEILDQVTINAIDFTIISIKRDLVANEMTLKLVEF